MVNVSIGLHQRDLNVRAMPSFTVRTVLTGIMTVMRKNAENMDFVLIKSETRYVNRSRIVNKSSFRSLFY